jgi:transcriptional regulator with XRE-family HTH domain
MCRSDPYEHLGECMPRKGVRGFSPAALRRLRAAAQLSLEDLGDLAGVSPQSISKWETGQIKPSPGPLAALAAVLRVSVGDLAPIPEADLQLSDLRFQAGLRQADVAAALNLSATRISDLERGRRTVDDKSVDEIAALYGVTPDLLRTVGQRTVEARATRLGSRT